MNRFYAACLPNKQAIVDAYNFAYMPALYAGETGLRLRQIDAREDLDHRGIVVAAVAHRRRHQEHLMRGGSERQREWSLFLPVSSTMPRSFTKISTAECGV